MALSEAAALEVAKKTKEIAKKQQEIRSLNNDLRDHLKWRNDTLRRGDKPTASALAVKHDIEASKRRYNELKKLY